MLNGFLTIEFNRAFTKVDIDIHMQKNGTLIPIQWNFDPHSHYT